MKGCTCRGDATLCEWCATLAARAGALPTTAPPPVSEKAFMQAVIRYAKDHSWLVYHTHDSRKSLPGYPDLTLCHPDRAVAIFAECKVDGGQLTLQQLAWLKALATVRDTTALLWTPEDWPDIRLRLT